MFFAFFEASQPVKPYSSAQCKDAFGGLEAHRHIRLPLWRLQVLQRKLNLGFGLRRFSLQNRLQLGEECFDLFSLRRFLKCFVFLH